MRRPDYFWRDEEGRVRPGFYPKGRIKVTEVWDEESGRFVGFLLENEKSSLLYRSGGRYKYTYYSEGKTLIIENEGCLVTGLEDFLQLGFMDRKAVLKEVLKGTLFLTTSEVAEILGHTKQSVRRSKALAKYKLRVGGRIYFTRYPEMLGKLKRIVEGEFMDSKGYVRVNLKMIREMLENSPPGLILSADDVAKQYSLDTGSASRLFRTLCKFLGVEVKERRGFTDGHPTRLTYAPGITGAIAAYRQELEEMASRELRT